MPEPTYEELVSKYTMAFATFNDAAIEALRGKVVEATDQSLIMFGEPKDYAGFRTFSRTLTEGLIAWLIAEGYLVVPMKHVVSAHEAAERDRRREERSVQDPRVAPMPMSAYL